MLSLVYSKDTLKDSPQRILYSSDILYLVTDDAIFKAYIQC